MAARQFRSIDGEMPTPVATCIKGRPRLRMAQGPLAGGLIYDAFASYTWLYVASWAMGRAAFLSAMTFRPLSKAQPTFEPAAA